MSRSLRTGDHEALGRQTLDSCAYLAQTMLSQSFRDDAGVAQHGMMMGSPAMGMPTGEPQVLPGAEMYSSPTKSPYPQEVVQPSEPPVPIEAPSTPAKPYPGSPCVTPVKGYHSLSADPNCSPVKPVSAPGTPARTYQQPVGTPVKYHNMDGSPAKAYQASPAKAQGYQGPCDIGPAGYSQGPARGYGQGTYAQQQQYGPHYEGYYNSNGGGYY